LVELYLTGSWPVLNTHTRTRATGTHPCACMHTHNSAAAWPNACTNHACLFVPLPSPFPADNLLESLPAEMGNLHKLVKLQVKLRYSWRWCWCCSRYL
jgi:hypothetical protein